MTEKDLGLKVDARRLLWKMGYTTRLDVPLRASIPSSERRSKAQTYTDLDVLAYQLVGSAALHTTLADCKTSAKRATERIFWIRGVADLVSASEAWMVRLDEPPAVTRQLSTKLGIATLTAQQLRQLSETYPSDLAFDDVSLARLFSVEAVSEALGAYTSLDSRLDRLLEYRQFDFFVNDSHENLVQLVSHAESVSKHLDPHNPLHCSLFFDLIWLQLLSSLRAAEYIRMSHVGDINVGLQEYISGGQRRLVERRDLAALLQSLAPSGAEPASAFPTYFPSLRETITRLMNRPTVALTMLRYAEVATATLAAKKRTSVRTAFRSAYDPFAAKLVLDVAGYLVGAASLDPGFRALAESMLMDDKPVE